MKLISTAGLPLVLAATLLLSACGGSTPPASSDVLAVWLSAMTDGALRQRALPRCQITEKYACPSLVFRLPYAPKIWYPLMSNPA